MNDVVRVEVFGVQRVKRLEVDVWLRNDPANRVLLHFVVIDLLMDLFLVDGLCWRGFLRAVASTRLRVEGLFVDLCLKSHNLTLELFNLLLNNIYY